MNRHIELPISGNLWGLNSTIYTGTTVQFGSSASNTIVGCVMIAPESTTITDIGLSLGTPVGSAARTFKFEIRNVNSDGTPGSTVYAETASYSYSQIGTSPLYFASTSNPTVSIVPLTTPYAVTRGTIYCICISTNTGTWNSSNYLNIIMSYDAIARSAVHSNLPYWVNNGGTKGKNPNFLMASSSKFFGNLAYTYANESVSGSNAYGNFFTLPASFGTNVRMIGVKFSMVIPSSPYNTGNFQIKVYSGSGSTLYVDNTFNFNVTMTNSPSNTIYYYYFDSAITLTPGQTYFVGIVCPDDSLTLSSKRVGYYIENESKALNINTGNIFDTYSGYISSGGTPAISIDAFYPINPLIDYVNPAPGGGGASTTAVFNQGLFN